MQSLINQKIFERSTYDDVHKAVAIYNDLMRSKKDMIYIIGTIYKVGVIEGKRQDRARRKGGIIFHQEADKKC